VDRGGRGAPGEALQLEVAARVENLKRLRCQDVLLPVQPGAWRLLDTPDRTHRFASNGLLTVRVQNRV
jgi:hypothetical protein